MVIGVDRGEAGRDDGPGRQLSLPAVGVVTVGRGEHEPDGVHPNVEGYGLIAERLRGLGYEPLGPAEQRVKPPTGVVFLVPPR